MEDIPEINETDMPETVKGLAYVSTIDDAIARLQEIRNEHGNLGLRVKMDGVNKALALKSMRYQKNVVKNKDGQIVRITENCDIYPAIDFSYFVTKSNSVSSIQTEYSRMSPMFREMGKTLTGIKRAMFDDNNQLRALSNKSRIAKAFKELWNTACGINKTIQYLATLHLSLDKVIGGAFPDICYEEFADLPLDPDLSDEAFAKAVVDLVNGGNNLKRMAGYGEIVKKIDAEIQVRGNRIKSLNQRIAKGGGGNEVVNAKILIAKVEKVVEVLARRKEFVVALFKKHKEHIIGALNDIEVGMKD